MPSAKEVIWKNDMWLPRAIAKAHDYAPDHPWWTVLRDYANVDSAVTIQIFEIQKKILEESGLWPIYLERRKVMAQRHRMEKFGMTLSKSRLEELDQQYKEESQVANDICVNIAEGFDFELKLPKNGMNKSLTEFVFNVMKLPVVHKTDTGGPSMNKFAIDQYLADLPERSINRKFVEVLSGKRSRDTAISYMESYQRYWHQVTGDVYRLNPSLNPTGTDTLRWSSQGPNEQQISKKEGFNLRYSFGPAPGREWWSLDYQNLELRIPAYKARQMNMIELFEKPDDPPYFGSNHLLSASIVYPELFWPLANEKGAFKKKYAATYYQWIKNFNFAVQYGAILKANGWGTADRAAHKKGAHALLAVGLTEMAKLNQECIDFANQYGYVETYPDSELVAAGCERGYPLWCARTDNGRVLETVPLNYKIQGTACWVMMRAMDKVQTYLDTIGEPDEYAITAQVHDELVFDFPKKKDLGNLPIVLKIKEIMESCGELIGVPLSMGVEYHEHNWAKGLSV